MAMDLAMRVLGDLFPEVPEEGLRTHPDIHWLYPEKKTRIVSVEAVHAKFIDPMGQTSFSGGWKVGVLVGADCLNPAGANAFLKTLEEPPPKTLFLLLTDAPERILPTVVSRCQRVDLPDAHGRSLPDPWRSNVLGILADPALGSRGAAAFVAKASASEKLAAVLEELKKVAENDVAASLAADRLDGMELSAAEEDALVLSRYREHRRDFLFTMTGFFAERMRSAPGTVSFRNAEAVEDLARMLDRNINEAAALSFFIDRVQFGGAA